MPTKKEIEQQINALGEAAHIFGTKKEVNALPDILVPGEEVKGLTSGVVKNATWLIVCTTKRILFLDKGLLYGLKQVEIPLDKVNSIEQKKGIFMGEITIWNGANQTKVEMVNKKSLGQFVNGVNEQIEKSKNRSNQPVASLDVADQLKKLAGLKDDGTLTEEEFQAQKRKILSN